MEKSDPQIEDSQFKDLSSLLRTFMEADGSINPDKAPPDMKVIKHLSQLSMVAKIPCLGHMCERWI